MAPAIAASPRNRSPYARAAEDAEAAATLAKETSGAGVTVQQVVTVTAEATPTEAEDTPSFPSVLSIAECSPSVSPREIMRANSGHSVNACRCQR